MSKRVTALELPLGERGPRTTVTAWLYGELRSAMTAGRLQRGARLPASRDLARQHGIGRGTVLAVLDQLRDEGYVRSRRGAGCWVCNELPDDVGSLGEQIVPSAAPASPLRRLLAPRVLRPFLASEPAIDEFPLDVWSRIAARRWRRTGRSLLMSGDAAGCAPLREAIAGYLTSSRGVRCSADQVLVTSGAQHALDLVARALLRPGDEAWLEDPGYFGALAALRNAGARIVGVPVDGEGLDVACGVATAPRAKLAYVTPAHQFPMGASLSPRRRRALLAWAESAGAFIIEDDYDSEHRFAGQPIPALQGMDRTGRVLLAGSFNKALFPSLRLGYLVVPEALVDTVLMLRFESDLWPNTINQMIVAEFITEGHLGRHIRRMRALYAARLEIFHAAAQRYLHGALDVAAVPAGLWVTAFYRAPIASLALEEEAAQAGVSTFALDRCAIRPRGIPGFILGFAAFDQRAITAGMQKLATVLERHRA